MSNKTMDKLRNELINLFDSRVAFHHIERLLYSDDAGNLPELVRRQINAYPDAIVQPNNREELIQLAGIAKKHRVPLVPRGAATSGYGGCIPAKGGIVVDFYRLNHIIDIDKQEKVVTVEPGVVWNSLEKELNSYGLALRLYPGSMISSTVGGWVATGGGAGIGSYEYGYINENILEVETVTTEGIQKLTADDISLVYGMAGCTGLISEVRLKVRDSDDDNYVAAAFSNLDDMITCFRLIQEEKLELWHAGYRNPHHIRLTHQALNARANDHHREPPKESISIPEDKYIALFVYPRNRVERITDKLSDIINRCNGTVLPEQATKLEWEETLYPLRFKRLGPSLIPSGVVIETKRLPLLFDKNDGAIEGMLINGGNKAVLMRYVLSDERCFGFSLALTSSLAFNSRAKKVGGKTYTIGMYFRNEAENIFSRDGLLEIYKYKKTVDPAHVMNPGKTFPSWLDKNSPLLRLSFAINMAKQFNSLIQNLEKLLNILIKYKLIRERSRPTALPYGNNALYDAFTCSRCGYCRSECPEFNAIGWESSSPRGKFNFIRHYINGKASIDERMAELFYVCTTCRQCNLICQVGINVEEDWIRELRPAVLHKGFIPPMVALKQAGNIKSKHNSGGVSQDKRKSWMPADLNYEDTGPIGYFAGCAVCFNYNLRNLPINAMRILNEAGIKPAYLGTDEWCCGGTLFTTGYIDEVLEKAEHNINLFNERGIKTLIISCSGCWLHLANFYPSFARQLNLEFNISIKHITETLDELLKDGKIKFKSPINLQVTYHDSCHIGRAGGIYQPPRDILHAIPGLQLIEMPRNREHAACCGRHVIRYPKLGEIIGSSRLMEAVQTRADAVVTACPTCRTNFSIGLNKVGAEVDVIDISDLVVYSMGLPLLAVSKLSRLMSKHERVEV